MTRGGEMKCTRLPGTSVEEGGQPSEDVQHEPPNDHQRPREEREDERCGQGIDPTRSERLPPLEGQVRLGANVRVGYMAQEQELLDPSANALEIVRGLRAMSETDARAFLHYFLFAGDDVFVRAGDLSFGERARLSLASLVAQGCNFLLLDEPINHLDIPSRARFEQALTTFSGTALAVVHDRYFIAGFASQLWRLAGGRLTLEQA